MSTRLQTLTPELVAEIRRLLLELAKAEDDLAATEAARVPYWEPAPASVSGHRAAARALRGEADQLLPARLAA